MTTYRQIINRCLRNLGETEIDALATNLAANSYPALVGQWVNIIKNEIEDSTNWRVLQDLDTSAMLANTSSKALVNATQRSRVVRLSQAEVYGGARGMCYDVTDASNPSPLGEMDLIELKMKIQLEPGFRSTSSPSHFAVEQTASGLNLRVYPTPSTARNFILLLCTPEPRLDLDDLDVVISIPAFALELGSTWAALEERGEELGIEGVFTQARYQKALDSEVSRDEVEQGDLTEMTVV